MAYVVDLWTDEELELCEKILKIIMDTLRKEPQLDMQYCGFMAREMAQEIVEEIARDREKKAKADGSHI